MCLRIVKQANPKRGDLQREGFGWKLYREEKSTGKLLPLYRDGYRNAVAGKGKIRSDHPHGKGFRRYTAGFHVFVDRRDAQRMLGAFENRVVCRVKWRGLCASGTEAYFSVYEVLVVKEIISRRRVKLTSRRRVKLTI